MVDHFDHVHHIELFGRIVSHKLYSKIRQTCIKEKKMPPAIHSFREKGENLNFTAWLSVGLAPRKDNKTKLEFGIGVIKQLGTT